MRSPAPSDEEYDEPKQTQRKKRNPPAEPRKLMRWNPDSDQLVLLCIEAVCTRLNVALPWAEIAREVEPFLSAEGIKQHLGKLYAAREAAGRKVPEKSGKGVTRKSKANQIKDEDDDDAEPVTPAQAKANNRLIGLLYHGPETQPKKVRTPKTAKGEATPNSTGAGRKKAKSTLNREALLGTPTKSTTGKRGRKSQVAAVQEEEDADYQEGTPTKKQRSTYSFRAITKEPNYTQETEIADDEEDDENLLAAEEDDDDEYKEDEDYEDEDEQMEDVKVEKMSSEKKNSKTNMPPPTQFDPMKTFMASRPDVFGAPKTQQANKQPEQSVQTSFMQTPVAYNNGDDPFHIQSTPRSMPPIDYSLLPHPNESAMRSTLDKNPRATLKEEQTSSAEKEKLATKIKRPGKPRKGSQNQIPGTPVQQKLQQNASQAGTPVTMTPVNRINTPANKTSSTFRNLHGSPFNTPEQNQAEIDAMDANIDELGFQNNYTVTMPLPNSNFNTMNYLPNGYVPGAGVMGFNLPDYGLGTGIAQPNLHVSTNANPLYGGAGAVMMLSPQEEYAMSGGSNGNFQGRFDCNGNMDLPYAALNHGNSQSTINNSGATTQPFSQNSGTMPPPTPTHTGSFDSMATVPGSQTDEANQYMAFDGGNDSPSFFEDAMSPDLNDQQMRDPAYDQFFGNGI